MDTYLMEQAQLDNLKFCWWNTSLSPSGKARQQTEEESYQCVDLIIREILSFQAVDFLAIGEVSENDVELLKTTFNSTQFDVVGCHESVGRGSFSQAYIYDASKLRILETDQITWAVAGRKYRAGHSLAIECFDGSRFLVIVSHWPSKLQSENEVVRPQLASILRNYCIDPPSSVGGQAHVILMGDYNSEPFEPPISEMLMASRDKTRVTQKNDLFYNPYWNKLGMSECSRYCGSYYHKNGLLSQWRLFDQILFSSSLVNGDKWSVDEKSINVGLETVYKLVSDKKTHFDHLPVFAIIERCHGEL